MKIAFIGKMHSGKSEGMSYFKKLSEESNVVITTKFATPLYKAQEQFKPEQGFKHREFLQELGDLAKKHFGENILNETFTNYISKIEENDIYKVIDFFCDDVRMPSEFKTVKEQGFATIGIKVDDEIRKQRNPKLFVNTNHKTETSVNSLIENCDFIIQNNNTLEEFKNSLKTLYFYILNT